MWDAFCSPKAKRAKTQIQLSMGEVRKGFFHLCPTEKHIPLLWGDSSWLVCSPPSRWCFNSYTSGYLCWLYRGCTIQGRWVPTSYTVALAVSICQLVHPAQAPSLPILLLLCWLRTLLLVFSHCQLRPAILWTMSASMTHPMYFQIPRAPVDGTNCCKMPERGNRLEKIWLKLIYVEIQTMKSLTVFTATWIALIH